MLSVKKWYNISMNKIEAVAKHYTKDMMTGRVAVAHKSDTFDGEAFDARMDEYRRQSDQINARAERLAIAAGFTRAEYRNARTRTQTRWQARALDDLLREGYTFSPMIVSLHQPA